MLLYPGKTKISDNIELEEFVLRGMKKDDLTDIVTSDDLLLIYGSFLLSRKRTRKANYISQNMRLATRLIEVLGKRIPDQAKGRLTKLLLPENFDTTVDCTKDLAGFSSRNNEGKAIPLFCKLSLPLPPC